MFELIAKSFLRNYGDSRVDIENYTITVHYHNITIKNAAGISTTIQDLYVKFVFNFGENTLLGIAVNGIRTNISMLEFARGFNHPYLSGGFTGFTDFCKSDFSAILLNTVLDINKIKTEEEIDTTITHFLLAFEKYLSFDSGAGYTRIVDLYHTEEKHKVKCSGTIYRHTDLDIKEVLKDNIDKIFTISYEKGTQLLVVNRKIVEQLILEFIYLKLTESQIDLLFEKKILLRELEGQIVSLNLDQKLKGLDLYTPLFTFKGEIKTLVFKNNHDGNFLEKAKVVLHKDYLDLVIASLNNLLIKSTFNKKY